MSAVTGPMKRPESTAKEDGAWPRHRRCWHGRSAGEEDAIDAAGEAGRLKLVDSGGLGAINWHVVHARPRTRKVSTISAFAVSRGKRMRMPATSPSVRRRLADKLLGHKVHVDAGFAERRRRCADRGNAARGQVLQSWRKNRTPLALVKTIESNESISAIPRIGGESPMASKRMAGT